MGEALKTV